MKIINLFYINTWYILAVPVWLIAVVVALIGGRTSGNNTP